MIVAEGWGEWFSSLCGCRDFYTILLVIIFIGLLDLKSCMEALEVCFAYRRLVYPGRLGSDQNSLAVSAMPLAGIYTMRGNIRGCIGQAFGRPPFLFPLRSFIDHS